MKNSFFSSGIMNLQHSQWNDLLGFGGLESKVAKSVINKYYGHKRSMFYRRQLMLVALHHSLHVSSMNIWSSPYHMHSNSEGENFYGYVENKQKIESNRSEK